MRVLLHPPGDSALDPIVMTEELLAIGRRQALFDRFPRSAVAKLSKRHARLFVENGLLYLVDLGSLNGSFLNGVQLDDAPRQVGSGDTLTFGDLSFTLEIQELPQARSARPLRLVLKPDAPSSFLETVVVSEFPFLISKNSELFQHLPIADPDLHSYLSRKHAQIIRLGERFYLEDLGSTNGTALNGQSIEEHLAPIQDGDRLSFGDEALTFRAFLVETTGFADVLEAEDAAELETVMLDGEPLSAELSEVLESGRTIMVDSATSFIDVYFNAANGEQSARPEPAPGPLPASAPKADTLSRAVLETLLGEDRALLRWVQGGALILALGVGVAGINYWLGADARRLKALAESDDPTAALALAVELLQADPEDEALQGAALQALKRALLPDWYASFSAGDFEQAREQLARADKAGAANRADDELLDLLHWATEVGSFIDDVSGSSRKRDFDPFAEAQEVAELLEFWTREPRLRMRVLRDLDASSSEFEGVAETVAKNVRRLRALELDTAPLRLLAEDLAGHLMNGNVTAVESLLEVTLSDLRLPRSRQRLENELENYRELERTMAEERWLDARSLALRPLFQTRIFRDYAQQLLRGRLPDAAFERTMATAADAWKAGDPARSTAQLELLLDTPWAKVPERTLARQQALLVGAERLAGQVGQRGYARALFDFYAQLDPVQDQALVRELRPAFKRYSTEALEEAASSLAEAERGWQRYNAMGRIQTKHRLAPQVDREFEALAGMLNGSLLAFERGVSIYQQLAREPSSSWSRLRDQLERELKVQRSALRNLQVLAPAVRQRKLKLLGVDAAASGRI